MPCQYWAYACTLCMLLEGPVSVCGRGTTSWIVPMVSMDGASEEILSRLRYATSTLPVSSDHIHIDIYNNMCVSHMLEFSDWCAIQPHGCNAHSFIENAFTCQYFVSHDDKMMGERCYPPH